MQTTRLKANDETTLPEGWSFDEDGDAVSPHWSKDGEMFRSSTESGVRSSNEGLGPAHVICVGDVWAYYTDGDLALGDTYAGNDFVESLSGPENCPHTDALLEECKDTLRKKGADYRSKGGRPFSNFEGGAGLLGVSACLVWFVYFYKHVCAIAKFCRDGDVASEPIRGRIVDAINYLLLLNQELETRKAKNDGSDA